MATSAGCAGRPTPVARSRTVAWPSEPDDLLGDAIGARRGRCVSPTIDAERRHRRPSCGRVAASGRRIGKPIAVGIPETRRGGPGALSTAAEHVVDERQNRRHRARKLTEIARRGSPSGRSAGDERGRLVEHRHIGIAEAVDRLLAIADDEDRRRQRISRRAEALTPAPDQLRHELPLRPAGVLELVHQHVTDTALRGGTGSARTRPCPSAASPRARARRKNRAARAPPACADTARARPRRSATRRATARRSGRGGTRDGLGDGRRELAAAAR